MSLIADILDYYGYTGTAPTVKYESKLVHWIGAYDHITNHVIINTIHRTAPMEFVLAHELYHHVQTMEGRLGFQPYIENVRDGVFVWLGDNYRLHPNGNHSIEYKLIKYKDAPWEYEANVMAYSYCRERGYQIPESVIKSIETNTKRGAA